MRALRMFNHVSLDGYFVDADGDMSWAHRSDPEWNEFVASNARGGGALVFGRVTFEMMANAWSGPDGAARNAVVAERMTAMPKFVFSRSLDGVAWRNSRLMKGELGQGMRNLKAEAGPDMVIMGSGSIVAQLTSARLIDEYQLVVNPIVLGGGRTLFENAERVDLELIASRTFGNGNLVLTYRPRPT